MAESPSRVVTVNGRNRRPWALQSREKLLTAATEEIAAVGFDKAKLVDIAKRAGMTAGSVYTWFENKEDLFRAALEVALETQLEANVTAMNEVKLTYGENWLVELGSLLPRNHGDKGMTPAQRLLIESYYAAWRDKNAGKKLLPRLNQHMDMYVEIITRAQKNGKVSQDINPRAIAMVLLAVPVGQTLMNLAGIERIEDSDWMPLILQMSAALKPGK